MENYFNLKQLKNIFCICILLFSYNYTHAQNQEIDYSKPEIIKENIIIKLPLTHQDGYGYFHSILAGISTYLEDENNPWRKTYLKVLGAPKTWTNIEYGNFETNIYQPAYQNYLLGNITKEWYEELQRSWDWKPDTLALSREPLKTKIAFYLF